MAYGMDKGGQDSRRVLVYDLGGGTFDVSLLDIDGGVFHVLATAGNTRLGGEDFDQRVIDHLIRRFNKKNDQRGNDSIKLSRDDPMVVSSLKRVVENAKRALSSQRTTMVQVTNLANLGVDLSETLTRARFEELNRDLFKKTLKSVEQVLKDAKVDKDDVDDIVLVGGSTRIPMVQDLLEEYFGKKASKGINPDEAVALGAAAQGAVSPQPWFHKILQRRDIG